MNVWIVKGKLVLPIAFGCKILTESKYAVVLDSSRFNYALEVFDKNLEDARLVFIGMLWSQINVSTFLF